MYDLDCRQLQLRSLTAIKSTQAAQISSLEQQDRVGTRVLTGLKAASAGKAADIELLRAQLQAAEKADVEAGQQLQLVQQQVKMLESSQHYSIQKEQRAQDTAAKLVGEVQQLQGQLAAFKGEQREAHKLRGQIAALKGEQREAQGRAGKQLQDAHSTIKGLTQEVHQG